MTPWPRPYLDVPDSYRIESIIAAHNSLFVGKGCFAIQFPTFASSTVNGEVGSILVICMGRGRTLTTNELRGRWKVEMSLVGYPVLFEHSNVVLM